ncbi:MAG: serine/threonine protein kinase [Deltaproteobacteria bacterium]|nr:serine/threonine protein kinase [Deltaproteobacteria bacterium]
MAELFVARVRGMPGVEKIVVLKKILPQLASDHDFIKMFLDEARIASSLQHPNIVQMYDIGVVDGAYFISMEYLHGEDVRTLIKALGSQHVQLPLEHALNIIIGAASGLHYAHDKKGFDGKPLGIVHRDVTPQNIFITYDGGVKLVDFGIAKASNRAQETRYGTLKGKIPYMSPEQAKSEVLDRRSDVFALGIMLYELTTRTRLFKGDSEFAILKQIVEGEVTPPSALHPDYPPELERIVLKALTKDRKQRYQSAEELQDDLETFARDRRLAISPIALARFMERVFGKKIEAWREAQAGGKSLAAHLAEGEDVTVAESGVSKRRPGTGSRPGDSADADGDGDGDGGEIDDDDLIQVNAQAELESTPSGHGQVTPPRGEDGDRLPWKKPGRPVLLGVTVGVLVVAAAVGAFLWVRPGQPHRSAGGLARDDGAGRADAGAGAAPGQVGTGVPVPAGADGVADAGTGAGASAALAPDAALDLAIGIAPEPSGSPDAGRPPSAAELRAAARERDRQRKKDRDQVSPSPVAKTGEGELRVSSSPSCEIMIDGKSRGSTPMAGIKLSPGKHRLQLVNSRFGIDRTLTVEIVAGEVTKKKYDFPVTTP